MVGRGGQSMASKDKVPATGTVKSLGRSRGVARYDEKTIRAPSGVQPTASSVPGWYVSRRGSPPADGTTYMRAPAAGGPRLWRQAAGLATWRQGHCALTWAAAGGL